MENPERKKNQAQRHRQIRIIGGGGGDIGAVVVWGGAMAVAGLVAGFAIKGWFGRRKKKDSAVNKEEPIKKTENVEEEEGEGRVGPNDSNTKANQTQIDFVSALLGEKPKGKDDGATANTIAPQDIVPLINYAIPAPITTVDPDVQEVIPFTKLKPELIADIVEECKSMSVEKSDPIGPVERLILKPVMSQLTLEAEALLSPRHDHDHNTEDEVEYEADEEEESADDEKVSEEKCISSSAIWPEEMIEELSRELKGMMIDLEEEDTLKKKKNKIMNSNKNEECDEKEGGDAKNEAVPVAVAKTAKLAGSSSWVRVSMLVTLLLLLLLFHFDAMFLHR